MVQTKILHKRSRNLLGGAAAIALLTGFVSASAYAQEQKTQLDIPAQPLASALKVFSVESDSQVLFNERAVAGHSSPSLKGNYSRTEALALLLQGTNLHAEQSVDHVYLIKPVQRHSEAAPVPQTRLAEAVSSARATVGIESVVVTSSKIKGDIQTVPIAITALSQEQLTSRQIAGGPDLVKEVPNLTFSKTNFSGYTIQIRGIGTQAISVTTDPAVAVALNDIPFIRNHFFEQEFFDVNQVEVLRGPQGTLYGRNATAGVVNVISAKPTDQFEAMASADIGNYHNRRFEGMVNVPIVDDRVDFRIAGEWTKRDGYTENRLTGQQVDGRDLWSSRASLSLKPTSSVQATLIWEHFQESDDRMRTAKQLCKTDPGATDILGIDPSTVSTNAPYTPTHYLSQGCLPASLYSSESFEVPNGFMLPYYIPLSSKGAPLTSSAFGGIDPYASTTQSRNLRVIETHIDPIYKAKNDTLELNTDYQISPALTLSSQTGYNRDFLWSTEDYNRFDTTPGVFAYTPPVPNQPAGGNNSNGLHILTPDPSGLYVCATTPGNTCGSALAGQPCTAGSGGECVPAGVFCDPQLGCSDRLVAEDLNDEHAWQLSQEFRLASNFNGPFNFSIGGNFLHYETEENYYVFINTLTMASYTWALGTGGQSIQTLPWNPGVSDNSNCLVGGLKNSNPGNSNDVGTGEKPGMGCMYIDPNPLTKLNNEGHNYFLSQNPYALNSYAGFGEVYYSILQDLKLTGGLRWTEDQKHFTDIPSELLVHGYGYPVTGTVDQKWDELTGRAAVNWSPKIDFTDQTLVYGSYSHGYKAGGANPPGAILLQFGNHGDIGNPIHPLIFKPEFVDAFELGTKNTMLDGGLTLNGDVFFYNYKGYQISRIVDRTSINDNFDAKVRGAELEASWEPSPGLKFNFAGGYEDARLNKGSHSVDLIDRADTANHPGWMVIKPFVTQASNCVLPDYVVAASLINEPHQFPDDVATPVYNECAQAYAEHNDPVTKALYGQRSFAGYPGFDPLAGTQGDPYTGQNTYNGVDYGPAPNNGQGFDKDLSGNQLPNAPHFTTSLSAEYTMPVSEDWAATLHSDFYWQSQSWARVFNDRPYDKLRGYSNVNLALILTSASGWQAMGYLKNVFDTTAVTGDFLNSDDSGLTTNVFLTDPRLFGVRVTKNW